MKVLNLFYWCTSQSIWQVKIKNVIFKFMNYNGNIILFLILKIAFVYIIPTQYDNILNVKTICIFLKEINCLSFQSCSVIF